MNPTQKFLQARDFLFEHQLDYETAYRNFQPPEFDEFNWAIDFFDVQAAGNETTALWIVEETGAELKLSFSEMAERSNRVANFFRALGLRRGDHILVMLGNQLEIWETMLAAIKLGLVIIPCSTLLTADDLVDRIRRGQAKVVVTNYSEIEKFSQFNKALVKISVGGTQKNWISYQDAYSESASFAPECITKASDPLLLYFTSGTTSKPKLVLHSHQSYPVGHLSTMYWIGLRPGDVHFNISSPGWAKHAWSSFFAPWNAGATVFVYNYERFNARKVLETLERCRVTTLCAPPTVWRMLIQENLADYPVSLREIVGAGEPLNPEIIEQVRSAWQITIRDGYGQTETTAQIGNSPGQTVKDGSMGRALPGYKVSVLDPDGIPAREGEVSLDLSENPVGLMLGYRDAAEKNTEAMRGGFYHTGDIAVRDNEGYLTFVGRNDDIFKSSDYRISPFELESILLEHESIAEAAVVPSPDAVRLSVPKAFIVLSADSAADSATALSIFRHCRERLAPYKRVRRIEFSELPKTISGKIRRVELRKTEEARDSETRPELEFCEEDFSELLKK
ncbi:MAG TPA: AMP-binding protein [Pyrinomonadaceae bacterium]|nr:AMP-binding protein [Pyrinomonadaceae bacterium]